MSNFILRYAAAITGAMSTLLQVLVAYGLHLSTGQVGVINAIVAAGLGLATAALVARDRLLPAILAFTQGLADLLVAFGLHLTDQQVSTVLALVAAIVTPLLAAFTHTQVDAAVDKHGQRVPRRGWFRLAA